MNKYILALITSVIVVCTYYLSPFFSFFIFIPIFILLEKEKTKRNVITIYLHFFLFNLISTYWLANVQLKEGILTWLVNSLLMTLIAIITILVTKKNKGIHLIFISFWMSFEVIHHLWVFNWPWLSLGNIFCTNTKYIQWYKFTGMEGGTLWILLINYVFFKILQKKEISKFIFSLTLIIFPIIISLYLFKKENTFTQTQNIIITQPNANTTKIYHDELNILKKIYDTISQMKIIEPTILLLPETFIKESVLNNRTQDCRALQYIENKKLNIKNISTITGIIVKKTDYYKILSLANKKMNSFDTYDAAMYLSSKYKTQVHFKSKLIPVEEYLPNALTGFGFKSDNFSLGNDYQSFKINDSLDLSTGICYEIIFGHSIAEMVTEKTGAILMIANEQLLSGEVEKAFYTNISKLRAIENGKYLVKSSNTGLSGIINEKGEIVYKLDDNKFGLANISVPLLKEKTFYTRHYSKINYLIIMQGFLMLFIQAIRKTNLLIKFKSFILPTEKTR